MKISSLFVAAVLLASMSAVPAVGASPIKPAEVDEVCQAMSGADVLVKETQVLLSHDAGGALFTRQVAIPAGTYNIDAISYEGQHPDPADIHDVQTMEQWSINLFSGSELVYSSGTTNDVPASDTTITSRIGTNVTLFTDIDSIQYVHAAYGHPTAGPLYNSVVPSCIGFTNIAEVNTPECTISMVQSEENPFTFSAGIVIDGQPATKLAGQIDWGDGTSENISSLTPSHIYEEVGTYTVVASIVDDENSTAICTATVEIEVTGSTIVLGDTDTDNDNGEGNHVTTPNGSGNGNTTVLGATDVLADTGIGPNILVAVSGLILVLTGATLYKPKALATVLARIKR